jgi:phage terminase large subunit
VEETRVHGENHLLQVTDKTQNIKKNRKNVAMFAVQHHRDKNIQIYSNEGFIDPRVTAFSPKLSFYNTNVCSNGAH